MQNITITIGKKTAEFILPMQEAAMHCFINKNSKPESIGLSFSSIRFNTILKSIQEEIEATEQKQKENQSSAMKLVQNELERCIKDHGLFVDSHQAYGVIMEEIHEMFDEIKMNNLPRAIEEAVQVAAMAIKFILSCEKK
jgi:phage terminase large subunit-like protein